MFARLREDIRVVFDRDPAARTFFEVLTTYPGLHAILWHRMSHELMERDQFQMAGALVESFRTLVDRHRDSSGCEPWVGGCSSITAWVS
jgi:serine acetyltransferase